MIIKRFTGGPVKTHAYLVGDEQERVAIAIDPSRDTWQPMIKAAGEADLTIITIVNTHGHWDHIADNSVLQQITGAAIAVHPSDAPMLSYPWSSLSNIPFEIQPTIPTHLLNEGAVIEVGSVTFQVLHTPGHTGGGICLYEPDEGVLFTGDTLFAGTHGRTDLPGGSSEEMAESLSRLAVLPPDVRVFPGHGRATTIGGEGWLKRLYN